MTQDDASDTGRFYASEEAKRAYGNMMDVQQGEESDHSGREGAFGGASDDPYGGRVPYKSRKQQEAEQQQAQQPAAEVYSSYPPANGFAPAQPQQPAGTYTQSFQPVQPQQQQQGYAATNYAGYAQTQPQQAPQQPGYMPAHGTNQQPARGFQQPDPPFASNVVPFPTVNRGPDGAVYSHVEYVVHLHSRSECANVIEYIKTNASVFLNIEYIANDTERQRCVDMLSGAAYTLGCNLNRISARGMYLISAPTVCVVMDPTSQKYSGGEAPRGFMQQTYQQEAAPVREPEQPAMPMQPQQQSFSQTFMGMQQRQQPVTEPGFARSPVTNGFMGSRPAQPGFPAADMGAKYAAEPPASAIPRTPAATGYGRRTNAYQQ